MRRDRSADPGMNELLIVAALQDAPRLGIERISLNFAMFRSALARGEQTGRGPGAAGLARPAGLPVALVPDRVAVQVQRQVPAALGAPLRRLPHQPRPAPDRASPRCRPRASSTSALPRRSPAAFLAAARAPPLRPRGPVSRSGARPARSRRSTAPVPGLRWSHEYVAWTGHGPRPAGVGPLRGHGCRQRDPRLLLRRRPLVRHDGRRQARPRPGRRGRRPGRRRRRVDPPRRHPGGRGRGAAARGPGRPRSWPRGRHGLRGHHARLASPSRPSPPARPSSTT